MKCSECQSENAANQKFCGECGTPLAVGCPACGAANPPRQKFCGECGASLTEGDMPPKFTSPDAYTPKHLADRILTFQGVLQGERKQVTVLFADIKGSLELIEGSDPEQASLLLDSALGAMMDAVHRYEGTVNKVLGDGIMALFGAPLAHEDHAVRACYAGLAMQDAVQRAAEQSRSKFGVETQIRVGLNSGQVVVRAIGNDLSMDYDAIGHLLFLAADVGPAGLALGIEGVKLLVQALFGALSGIDGTAHGLRVVLRAARPSARIGPSARPAGPTSAARNKRDGSSCPSPTTTGALPEPT